MSAIRETVRALGGKLEVTSNLNQGTTLSCRFASVHDELTNAIAAFGPIQPSLTPEHAESEVRLRVGQQQGAALSPLLSDWRPGEAKQRA